ACTAGEDQKGARMKRLLGILAAGALMALGCSSDHDRRQVPLQTTPVQSSYTPPSTPSTPSTPTNEMQPVSGKEGGDQSETGGQTTVPPSDQRQHGEQMQSPSTPDPHEMATKPDA